LLDQTRLPAEEVVLACQTVDELIDAIQRLVVRGAPALGAAGALGVALALREAERKNWSASELADAVKRIREARPTAVNLAWGVDRVKPFIPAGFKAVLDEANALMEEDTKANRELSRHGADWLLAKVKKTRLCILTHCNTGALATTSWGTALGIIHELAERDAIEMVYADETRPLLQGSRLTAWELEQLQIPYKIQVDGAAASTIMRGLVDAAIIGADRIARNGDTANKIGSLGVALACQEAKIPFIVAAPASTVDLSTTSGEQINIELRKESEVLSFGQSNVAPSNARAFNPAFDVTPRRFISAIVTEFGVFEPNTEVDKDLSSVLKALQTV
jgi:methylthioribose-1-phosphate isomerase